MLISKTLPVISTELVVGVKVHLDAHARTGEFRRLNANQALRRDEMLLAAHAVTGLASVGKVVLALELDPLALRHLNAPAMPRAGYLGSKVVNEHHRRSAARRVPTWDEILLIAQCYGSWMRSPRSTSTWISHVEPES